MAKNKALPKKKDSSSSKRAPHAYNLFVAEMMPILCKMEIDNKPVGQRRKPCELMADIGSLWQSRKNSNINICWKNFQILNNVVAYNTDC